MTNNNAPTGISNREVISTPSIGPKDILVYVMASGINYNNVWAGLGQPVDVIADRQNKGEPEDFCAGGIDGDIDPCLSDTYSFDEIGHDHQLMHDNKHPYCNMACLVNATERGQGAS